MNEFNSCASRMEQFAAHDEIHVMCSFVETFCRKNKNVDLPVASPVCGACVLLWIYLCGSFRPLLFSSCSFVLDSSPWCLGFEFLPVLFCSHHRICFFRAPHFLSLSRPLLFTFAAFSLIVHSILFVFVQSLYCFIHFNVIYMVILLFWTQEYPSVLMRSYLIWLFLLAGGFAECRGLFPVMDLVF